MAINKKLCADLAKFLVELDSHGIYAVDGLGKDIAAQVPEVSYNPKLHTVKFGDIVAAFPVSTSEETRQAIEVRGVGGWLKDTPSTWLVSGWDVAITLCQLAGVGDPSGIVEGRGSKFRLCVEALERAAR